MESIESDPADRSRKTASSDPREMPEESLIIQRKWLRLMLEDLQWPTKEALATFRKSYSEAYDSLRELAGQYRHAERVLVRQRRGGRLFTDPWIALRAYQFKESLSYMNCVIANAVAVRRPSLADTLHLIFDMRFVLEVMEEIVKLNELETTRRGCSSRGRKLK